jgi:protein-disulfide isomerase
LTLILRRAALGAALLLLALTAGAAVAPTATPEDYVLGRAEAPITIIEYASLSCPHCAHFHAVTLPGVLQNWILPGRARLVFRDYPIDKGALLAAMLARCAERPVYFDLIGDMFAQQEKWATADDLPSALAAIGMAHGLTADQVRACWVDEGLANRIIEGAYTAQKEYGVGATPTFFINGVLFDGDQGWDVFNQALEAAAAKTR